jgi:hypothetical protein
MLTRRTTAAAAMLLVAAYAETAQAQNTCNAAYEQADVLVHGTSSTRLLDARDKLRICSGSTCKSWMVKDCTKWLAEVEGRIPSVILTATDGSESIAEAKVTADGAEVASRLDGRAIEIDPGEHTFVFKLPDGRTVEKRALVREGQKGQAVAVTFTKEAAPAAKPTPTPTAPTSTSTSTFTSASPPPLRSVGLVMGGAGIVGLSIGAIFGFSAMSAKDDAQCGADNLCADPGRLADARSQAKASTWGLVVGGALLAGGVTLFLLAPRDGARSPRVGVAGSSLTLGGTW